MACGRVGFLLVAMMSVGCGSATASVPDAGVEHDAAADAPDPIDAGTDADLDGALPHVTPHWTSCPLYVDQPDGTQAECATIDVPLRWSELDGPSLGIFVQRLRGSADTNRAQLWLLNGGPGGSGADYDSWMESFVALAPDVDVYAVDHRGVGRSSRLSCPEQESASSDSGFYITPEETAGCHDALQAEWGTDLAEFTTTAAARDLGRLIEVTARPGQDVFIYGASYGTYWAHRYLQIHPSQATGVILDSIAPPTENFVEYDAAFDAVGHDFMNLCATDALCASKLGADPWAAVTSLFDSLEAGHCPEFFAADEIDAASLRSILGTLLMDVETRTYVPAVVYRLSRCDAGDVAAVENLISVFFGSSELTYYDTLGSDALFFNVALSELWPNADAHPAISEIMQVESTLHMTQGLTLEIAGAQAGWPAYVDDEFVGAYADTTTPLLMMNGDLDPQTPVAGAITMAPHFTAAHQTFITVPRAAHAVTVRTPVTNEGDTPCGMQIMLSFLADPTAEPNTECLAAIPVESFTGIAEVNEIVLGTTDLWENAPGATRPSRRSSALPWRTLPTPRSRR